MRKLGKTWVGARVSRSAKRWIAAVFLFAFILLAKELIEEAMVRAEGRRAMEALKALGFNPPSVYRNARQGWNFRDSDGFSGDVELGSDSIFMRTHIREGGSLDPAPAETKREALLALSQTLKVPASEWSNVRSEPYLHAPHGHAPGWKLRWESDEVSVRGGYCLRHKRFESISIGGLRKWLQR